jgi:hypothetical protein
MEHPFSCSTVLLNLRLKRYCQSNCTLCLMRRSHQPERQHSSGFQCGEPHPCRRHCMCCSICLDNMHHDPNNNNYVLHNSNFHTSCCNTRTSYTPHQFSQPTPQTISNSPASGCSFQSSQNDDHSPLLSRHDPAPDEPSRPFHECAMFHHHPLSLSPTKHTPHPQH